MADKKTATGEKGWVIPDTYHPIIAETLTDMLGEDAKGEPVDIKIADFDGVEYQIFVDKDSKVICLSMKMRCVSAVMPMGAKLLLDQTFGQRLANTPLSGYDVTVKIDPKSVGSADEKAKLIKACSEIRFITMGAPIERCFEALSKDASGSLKPMQIEVRQKEAIYIHPLADRVLIFYSIDFFDDTDRAIANIFLNEFGEAQRRMQNAPAVTFSKEPPGQLKSMAGFKEPAQAPLGYVMFTVFKMHVDKPEKIKNATSLFLTFRAYLHYHIKAAKTQLQNRMRSKVEGLLKILNRANPEAAEAEKTAGRRNTTTNTTKTFRRF